MLFVVAVFTLLLVILIPFFSVFVQTIKNLIFFILIVIVISVNLMLSYGMEFFPIFFILVYIGAIVVSTLFMVLTFDLKFEYIKRVFSPKALLNIFAYFLLTPVLFGLSLWAPKHFRVQGLDEFNRLEAYHQCLNTPFVDDLFCNREFGREMLGRGLYSSAADHAVDINYVSANLYSNYSALFLVLGIILTFALVSALAIIKIK